MHICISIFWWNKFFAHGISEILSTSWNSYLKVVICTFVLEPSSDIVMSSCNVASKCIQEFLTASINNNLNIKMWKWKVSARILTASINNNLNIKMWKWKVSARIHPFCDGQRENLRIGINIWAATCDFQKCGSFKSVDSEEPVQPPF